jgi:hypothetical protein
MLQGATLLPGILRKFKICQHQVVIDGELALEHFLKPWRLGFLKYYKLVSGHEAGGERGCFRPEDSESKGELRVHERNHTRLGQDMASAKRWTFSFGDSGFTATKRARSEALMKITVLSRRANRSYRVFGAFVLSEN